MATKASSASKRTTSANSASQGAPDFGMGNLFSGANPWFPKLDDMFKHLQVPGVDLTALIESRKRDIEALVSAQKEVYEGMRAVAQRQSEIASETIAEWQAAVQKAGSKAPDPSAFAAQSELAQQALTKAISNLRELAQLAAASQARAFELIQERSKENIAEMRRIMSGK
ncbi:MAG: TIGR01841 family phasin [Burkholderiaceae bacterium]